MEYDQPLDTGYQSELTITSDIRENLMTMSKWANFIAILGFVITGFAILGALFMGTMMSSLGGSDFGGSAGLYGAGLGGFMTIIYLAIAAFYFFMSLYLYRFASKMRLAMRTNNQESFSESIANHKSYYKLIGIMAIIFIALYALLFVVAIIGGSLAAF